MDVSHTAHISLHSMQRYLVEGFDIQRTAAKEIERYQNYRNIPWVGAEIVRNMNRQAHASHVIEFWQTAIATKIAIENGE